MNNHWNTLNKALSSSCFIIFLCYSLAISGFVPINNQTSKPVISSNDVINPSRNQEIPIPADGDCLYKSIMVAYLLPVANDFSNFKERLCKLIGKASIMPTKESNDDEKDDYKNDCKYDDEKDDYKNDCKYDDEKDDYKNDCKYNNEKEFHDKWNAKELQKIFLNLQRLSIVDSLRAWPFPKLVKAMKKYMGIDHGLWGGPQEVKIIAYKLHVKIKEYTPDPQDKSNLVLIHTEPEHRNSYLTLRIVKNDPTQEEAVDPMADSGMQQAQVLSVENFQHRQHYRTLLDKAEMKYLKVHPDQLRVNSNHATNNSYTHKSAQNEPNADLPPIQVPRNLMELRWSTSPYECAILSKHIYSFHIQEGEEVIVKLDNENEKRHFPDWKVYKKMLPQIRGYKAVIYHNAKKHQIVLAYRGSQSPLSLDGVSDWLTNLFSIGLNRRGYQEREILTVIEKLQEAIFAQKDHVIYGCTITGHSLGGWLAQLTRLMSYHYAQKNPRKFHMKHHMKVITFDSPGAKTNMVSMKQKLGEEEMMNLFDMTHYYSSPNSVNCIDESLGTRYRIVFEDLGDSNSWGYTLKSHSIDCFIRSFHSEYGYPINCFNIESWPIISSKQEYSHLFNFIGKNNLYRIKNSSLINENVDYSRLSSNQSFHQLYMNPKVRYQTSPHDSSLVHARHIPQSLRSWLLSKKETNVLNSLSYYLTPSQKNKGFWHTKTRFDSLCIVDFLCSFQVNPNPYCLKFFTETEKLVKKIKESENLLTNLPKIEKVVDPASRSQELFDISLFLHADYYVKAYCLYYCANQYLPPYVRSCILLYLKQRNVCVIYGYPGLGKSTLARLYGHQHLRRGTYQHIWWIDFTTLDDSLQQVVNMLKGGQHNHHMPTQEQHKKYLKKALEHLSGWLLIIDNAPDVQAIQNLLPTQGGHILITVRDVNDTWKSVGHCYQVPNLSQKHAYQLLTKLAPPKSEKEKMQAYTLIKELHCTPLALHNAGYNICNQKDSFYSDYLRGFQKQLRNFKWLRQSKSSKERYTKAIGATYLQSIEQIASEESDNMGKTLHILAVMAYLDPYGLTPDFVAHCSPWQSSFFRHYLSSNMIGKVAGNKGIQTLIKYGFLNTREHRIHEICQDITRFWVTKIFKSKHNKHYYLMYKLFPDGNKSIFLAAVKLLENIQKDATPHSSLRLIAIDHARALMKHVQHDPLLRRRLLCIMGYLQAHAYPLDLYIPPQAKEKGVSKVKDMHQQILSFINSRHSLFGHNFTPFNIYTYTPLLLIKGSAGTGKSTYAAWLTKELANTYKNSQVWAHIPIFIFLPAYIQENGKLPTDLISLALRQYGINHQTIESMRKFAKSGTQPFVFIMDSYDEAHIKKNIYTHCNLANWGVKYSKFIITCRTSYLNEMPQATYYNQGLLFYLDDWKAREINICPFDETKINRYINEFVKTPYNKAKKTKHYYQKRLTYDIRKMADTPFMLCMLLLSIPKIHHKNPSLYEVYNALTEVWLDREMQKPNTQVTRTNIMTFCEKLAFKMCRKEVISLGVDDEQINSFFKRPQFVHAPLRQISQGKYAFLQPSYRDFFVARYIIRNTKRRRLINQEILNSNLVLFLTKGLYKHEKNKLIAKCCKQINQARQQKKSGILVAYLLQILFYIHPQKLRDQDLSGTDLEGGNLIGLNLTDTLLRGANLGGQDLSRLKLPKDLSGCNFRGAKLPQNLSNYNLKGSNLSGQNLTKVKLPYNLSSCNLTGAQLPQDLSYLNLTGADLRGQNLKYVRLPKNLSWANLTGARLPKNLSFCYLIGADLAGQDLRRVQLPKNLSETNLRYTQLPKDLSGCNLRSAQLPQDLSGCDFAGAQLPQDLSACNLTGANLSGQNLTEIKLPKNLSECNFKGAQLPKDLSKYTLIGANLSDQNLTQVKLPKNLSGCYLKGAKLPQMLSSYNLTDAMV